METLKHLKGLIFDIDGTLVDSNDLHARAWQLAFERFGKTIDFDTVRGQIGKGGDLLVPDLLNGREMRTFGKELKEYRKKLFREEFMPKVRPFDGVSEQLRRIAGRGIAIAFASSAEPEEVEHYIELLDANELLSGHTSKEDAHFSKPSPEIFEAALEQLGTPAENSCVVGDTPYDILAAHRAALTIVAVRCGRFPEETLRKAELVMNDVGEVAARLDEIDAYLSE